MMKKCSINLLVPNGDTPLELYIEYDYYPASRGSRDSLGGVPGAGPALEPDDPEEIEITDITHKGESLYPLLFDDLSEYLVNLIFIQRAMDEREPEPEYDDEFEYDDFEYDDDYNKYL